MGTEDGWMGGVEQGGLSARDGLKRVRVSRSTWQEKHVAVESRDGIVVLSEPNFGGCLIQDDLDEASNE